MKKMIAVLVVVVCCLAAVGPVFAQPAITSISGSGGDGTTLTITGTGFGTKGVAAPLKFDDFSGGGATGTTVANGWTADAASNSPGVPRPPIYSTGVVRTGTTRSVQARFEEGDFVGCSTVEDGCQYSSSFGFSGTSMPIIYLDTWVYYNPASPDPRNIKLIRLHTNTYQPNLYTGFWCAKLPTNNSIDGMLIGQDGAGGGAWFPDVPWRGGSFWTNGWHHIQMYAVQSSPNISNATMVFTVDNVTALNRVGNFPYTRTSATQNWNALWLGNYMGHGDETNDTDGRRCAGSPGNSYSYWSDTYVDTTRAHVEIGNAATYTTCTRREIQPPTAWSSTSIAITVNRGAFANAPGNYVYVTDRTGLVNSSGFLIPSGTVDTLTSYFVPQAGPVNTVNTLEGAAAVRWALTCPNNDLLTNGARLKIVVANSAGTPISGIPAANIFVQINGGTAAMGFSGAGDDTLVANSTYGSFSSCPDSPRFLYANGPTDATGVTYIYWKGVDGTRDPLRKWGGYAGDLPVYVNGFHLSGRLTSTSTNGTYTAHVKNLDTAGVTLGFAELINSLDKNPVQAAIGGAYVYKYDFDNNGVVNEIDLNAVQGHFNHSCKYPIVIGP